MSSGHIRWVYDKGRHERVVTLCVHLVCFIIGNRELHQKFQLQMMKNSSKQLRRTIIIVNDYWKQGDYNYKVVASHTYHHARPDERHSFFVCVNLCAHFMHAFFQV